MYVHVGGCSFNETRTVSLLPLAVAVEHFGLGTKDKKHIHSLTLSMCWYHHLAYNLPVVI